MHLCGLSAIAACSGAAQLEGAASRPGDTAPAPPSELADAGGLSGEAAAPQPLGLTVLTLNLHCLKTDGSVYPTNEARFEAIALAARDENVDVLMAQEVCETPKTSARKLLEERLTSATGTPWSNVASFAHRAWEGTSDAADEYVAIFARGRIAASREVEHRVQGALRRVSLGATVEARLTSEDAPARVRVMTVHLDNADANVRQKQAREVAAAAVLQGAEEALDLGGGAVSMPVIVAGDFNARPATPTLTAMTDFGFVKASGSGGMQRIDHVFAHRSAPIVTTEARPMFEGSAAVSDHPGILVRFAYKSPAPARLTRIIAKGVFPSPMFVRGDQAPLSWDQGWPALASSKTSGSDVVFVTTELPTSPFAFKFLKDDKVWQVGDNADGLGGDTTTLMPQFP